MSRRPVAAVLTLGCKLNLADSGEIARGLQAVGYDVVDRLCEADAFVVNTCSVTHVADQKSRKLIRSVQRMSPGAAVTVTGCYPQSAGSVSIEELGADLVVGTRDADKERLVAYLGERLAETPLMGRQPGDTGSASREGIPPPAPTAGRDYRRTRVFVKAQEGCNDVCAFCIVPRTRGREESRSIAQVVAEVNLAVESGAKEVVITGTQLGAWGRDLDVLLKPHHLIGGILEQTEVARLRFSSLQPQDITPALLALWDDPRLMPHFHLALQSGSEPTLLRMRRRYSARDYRLAVERIRAAVPDAAITTDVIAGFPGETEEDFAATLALCEESRFARIHAFPYSPRAHTSAARMPVQVPAPTRQRRMQDLLALGNELAANFHRRFEGTIRPVLWENERPAPDGRKRNASGTSAWHGHTDNYIPVLMTSDMSMHNRITPVQLGPLYDDGLWGRFPEGIP